MDIEELSKKIDKYREEDTNKSERYRYQDLSYILWGFALGVVGIAYAESDWVLCVIAVIFLIGGFWVLWYSTRFRPKKH